MCYVQNCSKGNELGSYFVTGACTAHFQDLKVDLAARFADLKSNADLCNDVALAYVLMSDEAAVLALLDSLNNWLSSIDPGPCPIVGGPGILGAGLLVPASAGPAGGVLSSADFLDLIAHGCVLKDVGAGRRMGGSRTACNGTRLMAAMTEQFKVAFAAPWKMSPLKLYCSLGGAGTTQGSSSVWGTVFDLGGSAPSSNFRAGPSARRHPEVNQALAAGEPLAQAR